MEKGFKQEKQGWVLAGKDFFIIDNGVLYEKGSLEKATIYTDKDKAEQLAAMISKSAFYGHIDVVEVKKQLVVNIM